VKHALFLTVLLSSSALAKNGETGTLGLGDPMEVGVIAGPFSQQTVSSDGQLSEVSATLLGARLHAGGYTHQTLLGNGGGVEGTFSVGYALPSADKEGFWWAQLDALANVGVLNLGAGPFVFRLHALVGFGISVWTGPSLAGGGRVALGLTDILSLEAQWLTLPTVNLTFAHRAQAALAIHPIQLALGAELNFGSMNVGQTHFSLVGTLAWRPHFDD
jgi:hypothetical protein